MPSIHPHQLIDINEEGEVAAFVREKVASYLEISGIDHARILFTCGADAALHALFSLFAGKRVGYFDLAYRYANTLIETWAGSTFEIPTERDHRVGMRVARESVAQEIFDVLFAANPDNRLGLALRHEDIFALGRGAKCTIVDESYADYEPELSLANVAMGLGSRLAVVRTFSKFFSLESKRIGYVLSDPKTIAQLRRFVPQYPIATPSIIDLVRALSVPSGSFEQKRAALRAAKERFYAACDSHAADFARSHTNFVTVFERNPRATSELDAYIGTVKEFDVSGVRCYRATMRDF